jgi:hypothetical protein
VSLTPLKNGFTGIIDTGNVSFAGVVDIRETGKPLENSKSVNDKCEANFANIGETGEASKFLNNLKNGTKSKSFLGMSTGNRSLNLTKKPEVKNLMALSL